MRRIATALAAASLLAIGVGACGGTEDDSDKAAGAPAAKAEKLEPEKCKIEGQKKVPPRKG